MTAGAPGVPDSGGSARLRAALLTREFPPEVYGGAGVHVEYLSRELSRLVDLDVHCWGGTRAAVAGGPRVTAHAPWDRLAGSAPALAALRTLSIDLTMAAALEGTQVVHSHTWYADLGGHLAALMYDIPHVVTAHSLEPLRPWKAEQLGGGYALSTWAERTAIEAADAVVAVSEEMGRDILAAYPAVDPARVQVIYNGIDTDEYAPNASTDVLERFGIDATRPYVVFVGRITRQKGLTYLLDAAPLLDPSAQLVLCAGAPDTPEIGRAIADQVAHLSAERGGVLWIESMLSKPEVVQLLTHATVFVCPSIYEPLGIVNLEAMACGTAVVATRTGGIPEVVADGSTGYLVPFRPGDASRAPADPKQFAADFAERVNALVADPARAAAFGAARRARAVEEFSWARIAEQTADLYRRLAAASRAVRER